MIAATKLKATLNSGSIPAIIQTVAGLLVALFPNKLPLDLAQQSTVSYAAAVAGILGVVQLVDEIEAVWNPPKKPVVVVKTLALWLMLGFGTLFMLGCSAEQMAAFNKAHPQLSSNIDSTARATTQAAPVVEVISSPIPGAPIIIAGLAAAAGVWLSLRKGNNPPVDPNAPKA